MCGEAVRTTSRGAHASEYAEVFQWEKKTPWSFTISCCWGIVSVAERRWETSKRSLRVAWSQSCNTTQRRRYPLLHSKDSCRWIVWLGWYTLEKETRVPNARLRRVRNPP
jgi:hypothetical protein